MSLDWWCDTGSIKRFFEPIKVPLLEIFDIFAEKGIPRYLIVLPLHSEGDKNDDDDSFICLKTEKVQTGTYKAVTKLTNDIGNHRHI